MEKPPLEDIKYLGKLFTQDVWGNDGAEKTIEWYRSQLKRETDENARLEMENFRLSIKRPSFFRCMFNKRHAK